MQAILDYFAEIWLYLTVFNRKYFVFPKKYYNFAM